MTPLPPAILGRSGRRWPRQTGRWLVLGAAVTLAWPLRHESSTSVLLPALSPFIAVASAVSLRAASVLTLLALPILLLALFFPRWICRRGCPVGLLQECVGRSHSHASDRWLRWPAVGPWLAMLTLGGAVLGWPVFLWLDPLAIFHGFLNAWRRPLAAASLLTGLGLPLLLVLDLAAPRLWCHRICPLGAMQDLLGWPRRLFRPKARALEAVDALQAPKALQGRRCFLALITGATAAAAVRTVRGQGPPPLRPPGALDEHHLTGVCVRCGNCAQACPSGIIQPDFGDSGVVGLVTPRLCFDKDYCREDCHRCSQVCPSGAIARLSLADKRRRVIGRAKVDLSLCLLTQGRECTACVQKCPYNAIATRVADGGFSHEPYVVRARCNGCGACEAVCPTRPIRAVRVHSLTTTLAMQPSLAGGSP